MPTGSTRGFPPPLAADSDTLLRRMALHLRGGREDTKIFGRKRVAFTGIEIRPSACDGPSTDGFRSAMDRPRCPPCHISDSSPWNGGSARLDCGESGKSQAERSLLNGLECRTDGCSRRNPWPCRGQMVDPFGRAITYLRVSVTDRCDFRCVYCMAEDMHFLPKQDLLTLEELDRLAPPSSKRAFGKSASPAASRWCGATS